MATSKHRNVWAASAPDPRLKAFREAFLRHLERDDPYFVPECQDCGEDGPCGDERQFRNPAATGLDLQLRQASDGKPIWEHEFADVALICRACRRRMEEVGAGYVSLLRRLPPHVSYEAQDLLEELQKSPNPKVAFARAKNVVRDLNAKEAHAGLGEIRSIGEILAKSAAAFIPERVLMARLLCLACATPAAAARGDLESIGTAVAHLLEAPTAPEQLRDLALWAARAARPVDAALACKLEAAVAGLS